MGSSQSYQPTSTSPQWGLGSVYESYVGRWSRLIAPQFVRWLDLPSGGRWLDVGCGTGALTQTILDLNAPEQIKGIDQSEGFIAFARDQIRDDRVSFKVGDAQALPVDDNVYDAAVSALMLNFVPQPDRVIAEMSRAVKVDGTVALYVWDYAGKMQFMRHFWNAAVALNPEIAHLDEGRRSPVCNPQPLLDLFQKFNLRDVEVVPIEIPTDFKNFDDFWLPFLGGQGPAPRYTMSLTDEQRVALRERLRASLPFAVDGSIPLIARVWAVRGKK